MFAKSVHPTGRRSIFTRAKKKATKGTYVPVKVMAFAGSRGREQEDGEEPHVAKEGDLQPVLELADVLADVERV